MKTQLNYAKIFMGTIYTYRCSGNYRCSGLFLSGAEPCIGQQYFRSWNYSYEFYTFTAFSDHDGPECCSFDHRIHNMWTGIWYENRVYQYLTAGIYRYF